MILLFSSAVSVAQNPVRASERTARLMSRSNLVPEARSTTSVIGSVWSTDNTGVPGVAVRLRNLVLGEISAVTRTDEAGDFAFEQVPSGTYLLEVAEEEDGNPVALGDIFSIGPNETVVIFVKLPVLGGWISTLAALLGAPGGAGAGAGTFGTAVASVVSAAAGAGVTGIGAGRPASPDDQVP